MQLANATSRVSRASTTTSSRRSCVAVKAGIFDFLKKGDREPALKAAIKKPAPASAPKSAGFSLPSLPFFGGADSDDEEEKPAKRVVAAKKAPAASKGSPLAGLNLTRPKNTYNYVGNGKGSDRDFSTVESMRTGKMRPDNIDLNTPRSYWN